MKLALDGFGTGYFSLGYLNTLPIDVIKLDRTFIGELSGAREPEPSGRSSNSHMASG